MSTLSLSLTALLDIIISGTLAVTALTNLASDFWTWISGTYLALAPTTLTVDQVIAPTLDEVRPDLPHLRLLLQVDDAWLVALWDRIGIEMGLEAFVRRCEVRMEALNHALRGLPEDRIRYHMCWGSWHGPHANDIPLADIVDVMLKIKAQAFVIEGVLADEQPPQAAGDVAKPP